ncbi:MAG TPA: hypothetical protein VNF91_01480 [Candidatus Acidoferrum sp.]|nr:hypothetical protein [Candidatus Acidoferrum sp.]
MGSSVESPVGDCLFRVSGFWLAEVDEALLERIDPTPQCRLLSILEAQADGLLADDREQELWFDLGHAVVESVIRP